MHLGNQAGFDASKSGALVGQQQLVGWINPSSDLGQAICQSCDHRGLITGVGESKAQAIERWNELVRRLK